MSLSKRAGAVRNAITDLFRVSSSSRTNDDDNRQRLRPNWASSTLLPPSSPLTPISSRASHASQSSTLRKQAASEKSKMKKANKHASRARREGNRDAQDRHEREAHMHKSSMESLNRAAAEITFEENNKSLSRGSVDLHYLSVPEALGKVEQAFQSAAQRGDTVVRFIVGKGLHSKDGKAKIRPALEKLCDEYGKFPERMTPCTHPSRS